MGGLPLRLFPLAKDTLTFGSDVPPQTPWAILLPSVYSRHVALTGHSAEMRCASATPMLSLGKKMAGSISQHLPCAIQSASTPLSCSTRTVEIALTSPLTQPERHAHQGPALVPDAHFLSYRPPRAPLETGPKDSLEPSRERNIAGRRGVMQIGGGPRKRGSGRERR